MPVDFLGLPEDGGRIIDLDTGEKHAYGPWLEKHGETIWNEGFAAHRYRDCLTFRLDVEVYPVSRPDPRGHHGINFDPLAPGNATVYDPTTDNHNDDTASAFEDSLTGDFGLIDGETFAHELGHLMGLGDDYLRDENGHVLYGVVEGREDGSLMHGSETPTITQALVDRIGRLIEEVENLPECWTGPCTPRRGATTQPESPATCTDSLEGRVALRRRGERGH